MMWSVATTSIQNLQCLALFQDCITSTVHTVSDIQICDIWGTMSMMVWCCTNTSDIIQTVNICGIVFEINKHLSRIHSSDIYIWSQMCYPVLWHLPWPRHWLSLWRRATVSCESCYSGVPTSTYSTYIGVYFSQYHYYITNCSAYVKWWKYSCWQWLHNDSMIIIIIYIQYCIEAVHVCGRLLFRCSCIGS